MIHSLRLAVCSLQQYNIGEQRRSRIRFSAVEVGFSFGCSGA
jgi:hypothetical protein